MSDNVHEDINLNVFNGSQERTSKGLSELHSILKPPLGCGSSFRDVTCVIASKLYHAIY